MIWFSFGFVSSMAISGRGKFVDSKTIQVDGDTYTADHIMIAVGGRPRIPEVAMPFSRVIEALVEQHLGRETRFQSVLNEISFRFQARSWASTVMVSSS